MNDAAPMRLFLIATGQDTGGWNWRIHEAFRRNSDWTARCMAVSQTYIEYPTDEPFSADRALELYAEADVVHLQNSPAGWQTYDNTAGKPAILQHHGTSYRSGHAALSAMARRIGMVEICSTIDLTLYEPGVTWVPAPYSKHQLRAIRKKHYTPSDTVRIAHAPTARAIKGTDHFLAVIGRLQDEGLPVEPVLIEHQTWAQCLSAKANADVYYDQLELGYGNNAVEAWGMGIPVIAGTVDPKVQALMRKTWGRYPFAFADTANLESVIRQLVTSKAARDDLAGVGVEHFGTWHDERKVVRQLEDIYGAAPSTQPGPPRRKRLVRQPISAEQRALVRAARKALVLEHRRSRRAA